MALLSSRRPRRTFAALLCAAAAAPALAASTPVNKLAGTFDIETGTFRVSTSSFLVHYSESMLIQTDTYFTGDDGDGGSTSENSGWIYLIEDDGGGTNPNNMLPDTLDLTGTVRDFRSRVESDGHPDFQRQPTQGFAHYTGMVADQLDSDFKPVFASTGYRVTTQWRDASGANIIGPKSYISSRPTDQPGNRMTSEGGALTTAENFSSWYREVSGVNASTNVTLTLHRQPDTNLYVFDDTLDLNYAQRGGFFPIDSMLFGQSGNDCSGRPHNFHFTFELPAGFVYEEGTGQQFTFIGDDDVWVFIDGKLVIDLGGVHGPVRQTIELDRLGWLENGHSYDLRFFFAERHTCGSNFRIETTIALRMIGQPPVTSLAD